MEPKYPRIKVKLSGEDGNACSVLGRVKYAMKKHGVSQEEIKIFLDKAMSGNYDNLLKTCMEWVIVS